jgi:hypothetical protein
MLHKRSPTAMPVSKRLTEKLDLTGVEMRAINYNATQQRVAKIQEILD